MSSNNRGGFFIPGLFVAVGLALGGYFIGQTMYNAKVALNTALAKGLAERRVRSDRANWDIVFRVTGTSRGEIPNLYKKAEQQQQIIIKLLNESGFVDTEIQIGVLDYEYQEFRDDKQVLVDQTHRLVGTVSVETEKVDQIRKARTKVSKLIAKGIDIVNKAPAYRFTKLNQIKPDMLREATKNARIAANEFAENAGVKVGGIRNALQGGFYVRDVGEEYGDTAKIAKDVRVVTTITFYLTE
jgi:hypothetical protein